MKRDVFSAWFKELCSLVFVQTFQAFLLAIVLSIIVISVANSQNGSIDATGLLAIFALASFSKLELLIKNIFGLTSGVADPSLAGGKRSLMGSVLALGGLKSVLDNGRKVVGGGFKAIGGGFKTLGAKNAYRRAWLNKNGSNNGALPGDDDGSLNGAGGSSSGGARSGSSGGAVSRLSDEIAKLNSTISEQNKDLKNKKKDDNLDSLKAAIDSAKAERNEGLKAMFGGVAETAGALAGGTAGIVYGLASGENIGQSALAGMGVGDNIGRMASDAVVNIPGAAHSITGGVKEVYDSTKNRRAYREIDKEIKRENAKKIDELNKKLEMYKKANRGNGRNSNIDDVD